jgi:hypothetical protein
VLDVCWNYKLTTTGVVVERKHEGRLLVTAENKKLEESNRGQRQEVNC